MRLIVPLALCLLMAFAHSATAQKQPAKADDAPSRQGFFFALGVGAGSAGVDCSVCDSDERETGISGGLRIGASLSPNIVLALGTTGWYKQEDFFGTTVTSALGWVTATLRIYPSRTGGFWLEIGAGFMAGGVDDTVDELTTTGPGGTFGIGYDIPVGRTVSLTPYFVSAAAQGNLRLNGFTLLNEDFNPNVAQLGIALTVH